MPAGMPYVDARDCQDLATLICEAPARSRPRGLIAGWLFFRRFLVGAGLDLGGAGSRWSAPRTYDLDAVPPGPGDGSARKRRGGWCQVIG
jgi:hypothetical protein